MSDNTACVAGHPLFCQTCEDAAKEKAAQIISLRQEIREGIIRSQSLSGLERSAKVVLHEAMSDLYFKLYRLTGDDLDRQAANAHHQAATVLDSPHPLDRASKQREKRRQKR